MSSMIIRTIFLACCVSLAGLSSGQEFSHTFDKRLNCQDGKTQFQKDVDTGTIKLFRAGARGWSDTYHRLMLKRYGVRIIDTDLFGLPRHLHCYNELSQAYLNEKFGDTIYRVTQIEANIMDREGRGDKPAEHLTSMDSFQLYIAQHLDTNTYKPYLKQFSGNILTHGILYVDSVGNLTGIRLHMMYDTPVGPALDSMVQGIPYRAIPALDDGEPAPSYTQFHLRLNAETIHIYREFRKNLKRQ